MMVATGVKSAKGLIMAEERNITNYIGRFLGCEVKHTIDKETKKEIDETYGAITIAYCGIRKEEKTPWYSVQTLYVSTEKMHEICDNIPFDSKVNIEFYTGTTPGGKQRISKMTIVDEKNNTMED